MCVLRVFYVKICAASGCCNDDGGEWWYLSSDIKDFWFSCMRSNLATSHFMFILVFLSLPLSWKPKNYNFNNVCKKQIPM